MAHEHDQAAAMTSLTFAVRRRDPELVGPAAPTPRETKRLSDIDDQDTLRGHVTFVFLYRGGSGSGSGSGVHAGGGGNGGDGHPDPAGVIRRTLGEALVPYYPLAGRLREVEGRKLVVDCTGEGVTFVEADADVRLSELEAACALRPPFPCMDRLLMRDVVEQVEGSSNGVINCPLLIVQVTLLLCGAVVVALRLNHTICDAIGLAQFMSAAADLARGVRADTVVTPPAWSRELLEARTPPRAPAFPHREFDAVPPQPPPSGGGDMITRTFTFRPADVSALKRGLPAGIRDTATTFEALAAALWRARTAALELPPDEEVRLVSVVNIRGVPELGLPAGYYGNACVPVAVVTTAGALLAGSAGDAVELLRRTKAAASAEYVRSTLDLLLLRGRPCVALANLFLVSDNRRAGFHRVDFGWGEPAYGGPAETLFGVSFFIHVGSGSDDGVGVLVVLPRPAMDRFASEVETMLSKG